MTKQITKRAGIEKRELRKAYLAWQAKISKAKELHKGWLAGKERNTSTLKEI